MLFPDSPRPVVPYDWRWDFSTIVSRNPESGRVQTRAARSVDLLSVTLTYPLRPIADYTNLRAFCRAMRGMSTRFTFRDFNGTGNPLRAPWLANSAYGYPGAGAIMCTKPDGTAAVGDDFSTTFDLPFSSSISPVLYDSGYLTANYDIWYGAGVDGRDRVIFAYPLASGHVLTASCSLGRLTIYARLASDTFSAQTFVGSGGPIRPTLTIMQDVI